VSLVGPVREMVNRPRNGRRRKGTDDSSAMGWVASMLNTLEPSAGSLAGVCARSGFGIVDDATTRTRIPIALQAVFIIRRKLCRSRPRAPRRVKFRDTGQKNL